MSGRTFHGPSLARPNASLSTFMVRNVADLRPAFETHVPEPMISELCGVILLTHSFSTEDVTAFATSLPCTCYHAATCGTIGWDASCGFSHEVEQEGRAKELGSTTGVKVGGTAVTVIAVRREPHQREQRARVVLTCGSAPTIADGAIGHVVLGSMRGQSTFVEFIQSPKQAVCAGGLTATISQMVNQLWVQVDYLVLSFMDRFYTDSSLFNVCCAELLDEDPVCRGQGLAMINSLPSGYRPEFIGQFQCVLRGQAMYSKQNVESEGLEKILGQRAPVCGFVTLSEIGNATARNPDGWNSRQPKCTRFHAGAVVLCCFAVVDSEPWVREHTVQMPYSRLEQKQAAVALPARSWTESWFPWTCAPAVCCTCGDGRRDMWAYESVQTTSYKPMLADHVENVVGSDSGYQKVLRGLLLQECGSATTKSYLFWVPGARPNEEMFRTSKPVKEVDVFISQVIMPMEGTNPSFFAFGKAMDVYLAASIIATKLSRDANNPTKRARELLDKMTFWVDRACVDQDDDDEKMRIIKTHLEDFLVHARFFLCVITPHYFTRLWCIFEFCCAFAYREDFDTIVTGGFSSSFRLSEAQQIATSITNISVANARCFDQRDRDIIEEKIRDHFISVAHFETFTKTAALAMLVRGALPMIIEYNISEVWQVWIDTVRACEFHDLEAALSIFDIQKAHEALREQLPDSPTTTRIFDRIQCCSTDFVDTWFYEEVAPLIRTKRIRSLRKREKEATRPLKEAP